MVQSGDDNLLKFCAVKAVVMVVGRDADAVARGEARLQRLNDGRGPLFAGKEMRVAKTSTYLGVMGGELADGTPEMRKRVRRYDHAGSVMVAAGVRGGFVTAMVVSTILAGIGNKLTYAAAIWGLEENRLGQLDAVWARGHTAAMKLKGAVPREIWGSILGATPPSWRIRKAALWIAWHSR